MDTEECMQTKEQRCCKSMKASSMRGNRTRCIDTTIGFVGKNVNH